MSDEEKFICRCMCSICVWKCRRDEYCHCPFYYEEEEKEGEAE